MSGKPQQKCSDRKLVVYRNANQSTSDLRISVQLSDGVSISLPQGVYTYHTMDCHNEVDVVVAGNTNSCLLLFLFFHFSVLYDTKGSKGFWGSVDTLILSQIRNSH